MQDKLISVLQTTTLVMSLTKVGGGKPTNIQLKEL